MTESTRQEERRIRRAAHAWRVRLHQTPVPEAERQRFEAWIEADERHAAAFDRAETLHQAMGTLDAEALGSEVMRRSWRERLRSRLWSDSAHRWRSIGAAGIAASLILAIALLLISDYAGQDEMAQPAAVVERYATGVGEIESVTLADGSELTLGAGTSLTVTLDNAARRVVLTAGAIVFDVSPNPDRPFIVEAESLRTTVVGTLFEVRNNGGVARVAVAEGEVAVTQPVVLPGNMVTRGAPASLTAGQQVSAIRGEGLGEIQSVAPDAIGAWRQDRLVYAGATLEELVADARRYADLDITVVDERGALASKKVTAFFDTQDIRGMIETLPDILPVSVARIRPDTYEIRATL